MSKVVASGCRRGFANGLVGVILMLGPSPWLAGSLQVPRKDVLFGNPLQTSHPAEVDHAACVEATPEWKQIESEGIEKGSARYSILLSKAQSRVRDAVEAVAAAEGRDCVVRSGSYKNPQNLDVADITAQVVASLAREEG